MRTLALLLTFASASGAQHACEVLEPAPDASTSDTVTYCSVDPVTLDPQDACPSGYRCAHDSPPAVAWNVGECVPE